MNVCLLYKDRDFNGKDSYYDFGSMVQDLGLNTLFVAASKGITWKNGRVHYVHKEDTFLEETLRRVMRVPLTSKEEILYRQTILRDCLNNEDFVREVYDMAGELLERWDKLGRKSSQTGNQDSKARLLTNIQVMQLLIEGLCQVRKIFWENQEKLQSPGMLTFGKRLEESFSGEMEMKLRKVLDDLSFYKDVSLHQEKKNSYKAKRPHVAISFGLGQGLKWSELRLEEFSTEVKKFVNPYGMVAKVQNQFHNIITEGVALESDATLIEQAGQLEYRTVQYVVDCCMSYLNQFNQFFDQLQLQMGFYLAGINLANHLKRYQLDWCFPRVGGQKELRFQDLKEVVMRMEQSAEVVGNSCEEDGKLLWIVTGANQGGKSTFLRSIGIAQVMMQCGLMVGAKSYCSGIFPEFFTHFTRREDSSMNSGRLDEELRRMDQIIRHVGKSSMILLNESFASTTELEGSDIAYDIIRALCEQDVKILTVTHLLSFAQKMYDEQKSASHAFEIEFLSAERLENGVRTYRIRKHEPELTSFGLDLYRQVVEEMALRKED